MKRAVWIFILCCCVLAGATIKQPKFSARRDYPGLYGEFVQVADTNGDGIPDLMVCEFGSVGVLFGDGDGTFRPGPYNYT
jgi:hypothetical protein